MTTRKFYKTIVPLEILSEEPIGEQDIEVILAEARDGGYSMRVLENKEKVLNGKQAARALKVQASDPGFFQLTEKGEDSDEN